MSPESYAETWGKKADSQCGRQRRDVIGEEAEVKEEF